MDNSLNLDLGMKFGLMGLEKKVTAILVTFFSNFFSALLPPIRAVESAFLLLPGGFPLFFCPDF